MPALGHRRIRVALLALGLGIGAFAAVRPAPERAVRTFASNGGRYVLHVTEP